MESAVDNSKMIFFSDFLTCAQNDYINYTNYFKYTDMMHTITL